MWNINIQDVLFKVDKNRKKLFLSNNKIENIKLRISDEILVRKNQLEEMEFWTGANITKLSKNEIFLYGSNPLFSF